MNPFTDCSGFPCSVFTNQPILWCAGVLLLIATASTAAKWNDVMGYGSRAIRIIQWYPVIGLKFMKETRRAATCCATAAKVIDCKLPIVSSEIIRQGLFSGNVPLTDRHALIGIIFLPIFYLAQLFSSVFFVVVTKVHSKFRLVFLAVLFLGLAGFWRFLPITNPFFDRFAILFVITPVVFVIPIWVICVVATLFLTGASFAPYLQPVGALLFAPKIIGGCGEMFIALRTTFKRLFVHSIHPYAGIRSVIGVKRLDGYRLSGATLDAFNIIPQMGGV